MISRGRFSFMRPLIKALRVSRQPEWQKAEARVGWVKSNKINYSYN